MNIHIHLSTPKKETQTHTQTHYEKTAKTYRQFELHVQSFSTRKMHRHGYPDSGNFADSKHMALPRLWMRTSRTHASQYIIIHLWLAFSKNQARNGYSILWSVKKSKEKERAGCLGVAWAGFDVYNAPGTFDRSGQNGWDGDIRFSNAMNEGQKIEGQACVSEIIIWYWKFALAKPTL